MKGSEDECLVAVRSLEMSVLKCAEASGSLRGVSAHFRSFPGCQRPFCTFRKAYLGASGRSEHFGKLPWVPAAVLHISESFPGCQRPFCTFQKASLDASGRSAHFRKLPWVPAVVLHISESFPGCQRRFCTFQKAAPPLQNASLTLKRKPDCPLFPIP